MAFLSAHVCMALHALNPHAWGCFLPCMTVCKWRKEAKDNDVEILVLETPSHAKGKAGKVEFVSEQAGDGRKNSNHQNIWVDEDVIEFSSSKTKSCKKGQPGSSKQLHLFRILADSVLDKKDSDSSTSGEALKKNP